MNTCTTNTFFLSVIIIMAVVSVWLLWGRNSSFFYSTLGEIASATSSSKNRDYVCSFFFFRLNFERENLFLCCLQEREC